MALFLSWREKAQFHRVSLLPLVGAWEVWKSAGLNGNRGTPGLNKDSRFKKVEIALSNLKRRSIKNVLVLFWAKFKRLKFDEI